MTFELPSTEPRLSHDAAALAPLRGRRVVVTGAAGFIGAHVVAQACAAGADVIALVRPARVASVRARPGLRAVLGADLSQPVDFARAVTSAAQAEAPALIIHLAAIADWRQDPSLTLAMVDAHVVATAHLLEAARAARVARLLLFGSAGEYGGHDGPLAEDHPPRPLDPYSATKVAATTLGLTYHRSFGVPCTVVRPFVVYGPGESAHRLIPSIFARSRGAGTAAARSSLDFTSGEQRRDFVYVSDVAEGALRAALQPAAAGEVLNLGTGVATSVRQMASAAIAVAGDRIEPHFGGRPQRPGEPPLLLADMSKTARVLGWRPRVDVARGLEAFWYSARDGET